MASGRVRIRLTGLEKARTRIMVLDKKASDRSISKNFLRIAGGYNIKQCPVDTTRLQRSFRAEIRRRFIRLSWNTPYAKAVNDPHNAQGKPIQTTAKGYAQAIAGNTAQDITAYAKTGRKPRLRAARRFGNNRNSA